MAKKIVYCRHGMILETCALCNKEELEIRRKAFKSQKRTLSKDKTTSLLKPLSGNPTFPKDIPPIPDPDPDEEPDEPDPKEKARIKKIIESMGPRKRALALRCLDKAKEIEVALKEKRFDPTGADTAGEELKFGAPLNIIPLLGLTDAVNARILQKSLYGFSYKEIARQEKLTEAAVEHRIRKAKRELNHPFQRDELHRQVAARKLAAEQRRAKFEAKLDNEIEGNSQWAVQVHIDRTIDEIKRRQFRRNR